MSQFSFLLRRILSPKSFKLARKIKGRINGFLYRGDRFNCPICGGVFNHFLNAGDPGQERSLARCPRCDSLERHRLLWLFLNKETELLNRPLKVLHFAPERCLEESFLAMQNIDYVTADLDPQYVMQKVDITSIPFTDSSFDLVICLHVLEHVPGDLTAMKELNRITRPSGAVIVMVPMSGKTTLEGTTSESLDVRRERYGQSDHVRLYGSDISDRLSAAGFNVDTRHYAEELTTLEVERYRLVMEHSRFDRIETILFCQPNR